VAIRILPTYRESSGKNGQYRAAAHGVVVVIGHVGVVVTEVEFTLIFIPVIRGEFDDSRIAPAESPAVAGAEPIRD
jgi:hypothetical protein